MNLPKIKSLMWTAMAALFLTAFIGGCKKDTFEQIDGVCPLVVSTNPLNGATNVPLSQVITVTFNEEMNPESFTNTSFIITGSVVSGTISYSGKTVSFTPSSPLTSNHTYSGRVTTAVKDLMGNTLQTDYVWTFSTGALLSPMVILTDPANNDSNVVLNKVVSIDFSVPMDPLTITGTTVMLKKGITPIAGIVSYTGSKASFKPTSPLEQNTTYTGTVTAASKNLAGTPLAADYVWKFKTGSIIAPMVIVTDPANLATNVVLNKIITATFSVPMNPLTIGTTTFTLKQGATPIAGGVTYTGTTATFTPSANLLAGVIYTATITSGAKNIAGTPLANDYVWTFTTLTVPMVIATDPINNATGVALNKMITVNFNEPMDPLTLVAANFTIKQGATTLAGTISKTSTSVSFTPFVALLPNTVYNGTVTTGAKNVVGTAIAGNHVWTFTTLSLTAPTVILTDPVNNATGVALNKMIDATFSVPMNPSTLNASTFTLKEGTNTVSGTFSYIGSTSTFNPSSNLLAGTTYTATITTGAENVAGTPLANNYVWTFSTLAATPPTVVSTDPANNATGVVLDKVVTASFSVAMDASTLTSSTFTLKEGTNTVSGVVTYSGTTASFTPSVNLLSDATYTATITTGAKNVAGTALASNYVWKFSTKAHLGPNAPDLKTAGRFGMVAGVAVSNNAGYSLINDMDVGIYPGARSSITGFPPGKVVNGALYAADDASPIPAMLLQAKNDLTAAYLSAEGATNPSPATVSGDQGGKTLAPGIYKSTSTLGIQNGDLTLDAKGDANAVWLFQIASAFTTTGGSGGNVILSGGAQAKNVFWQVGSSATIGSYTKFKGTIMALTSITMGAYSTAVGRMQAINGAVTLTSTNVIDKP